MGYTDPGPIASGRTHRMLAEALAEARKGGLVVVVMLDERDILMATNRLVKMLEPGELRAHGSNHITVEHGGIKLTTVHNGAYNALTHEVRGWPTTKIFLDHAGRDKILTDAYDQIALAEHIIRRHKGNA